MDARPADRALAASCEGDREAELADALTVKSGAPSLLFASVGKLIVWAAFATVNGRATGVAAAYVPFPPCEAVIVQLPRP